MAMGPSYLLDTGVFIHYARASPTGQAIESKFNFLIAGFKPLVCVVSLGEIRAFSTRNQWGSGKLEQLEQLLQNLVQVDISHPDVIHTYAELCVFAQRKGRKIGDNDLWIAATSKVTDSVLITCDRDFDPLCTAGIKRVLFDSKTGKVLD